MGEIVKHPVLKRFCEIEIAIEDIEERQAALDLSISWLMARLCPEEADRFLRTQANSLEQDGRFPSQVRQFDELRNQLSIWRDLLASGK